MRDPQQIKPMRPWRIALVNALIAFLIVGHLYDVKTRTTHWPFGHYEMFAQLNETDDFARIEFVGVTADGREIRLMDASYSAPMPVTHTEQALVKASLITDPVKRREALKRLGTDFLRRYELRRQNGNIVGPPLAGMRIYARRWNHVDRWAANVDTPDTIEVLLDTGPLPPTTSASTRSTKVASSPSVEDTHP
jgi:hypothetical protein